MVHRSPWPSKRTAEEAAIQEGYRSGLEDKIAEQLRGLGIEPAYEALVVKFIWPQRNARYSPDFLLPNGVVVESKGRLVTSDRQKHLLVKAQHPDLDIRFVFSRSKTCISKTSDTTYAMWAEKNGFAYADKLIPRAWINEPLNEKRHAAARRWLKL